MRLPLCLGALKVGQPIGPVPVPGPPVWVHELDLYADSVQCVTGTLGGTAEPFWGLAGDRILRRADLKAETGLREVLLTALAPGISQSYPHPHGVTDESDVSKMYIDFCLNL